MGQFNKQLLENLALTVDPKNDDSMEVYGKLGQLGFAVDGLFDIYQFHNAVFKLLMLRAVDGYEAKGLDAVAEGDRQVTVSLEMTLSSPIVHSNEELVEHGVVDSIEDAEKMRVEGAIPVVNPLPGDGPGAAAIVSMINSGHFHLACGD